MFMNIVLRVLLLAAAPHLFFQKRIGQRYDHQHITVEKYFAKFC